MKNKTLFIVLGILGVYFGLTFFGGSTGNKIMYPLKLFVTFLHEFGHALGAIITGGSVENFDINKDASGLTASRGGNRAVILMGGYIGSAILGNLLFYIGAKKEKYSKAAIYVISGLMILVAGLWVRDLFAIGFLVVFALGLFLLAKYTNLDQIILMFLGLASILHIIQDFNVGPSSDLVAYADLFVLIPANVWMYVWLIIVVLLFIWNIRMIMRTNKN